MNFLILVTLFFPNYTIFLRLLSRFEEAIDFLQVGNFFLKGGDTGGEFFVLGGQFEELFLGGACVFDEMDEEVVVENPRYLIQPFNRKMIIV
ncbi:MAG: hypothetical protein FJY07_09625 [Bacteroidetes bacterium]|nr:hypothetical protein [Bacteroidota bacterium]